MHFETINNLFLESCCLALKCSYEMKTIYQRIFYCETKAMIKAIFQAIESMIRAVTYLLILIIGLSVASLGAYASIYFAIRIGQFLYVIFFRERWL